MNFTFPDLMTRDSWTLASAVKELGCDDVTHALDLEKTSEYPVAIGRSGDVYQGVLLGGAKVALKVSRNYSREVKDEAQETKRFIKEVYGWSKLKHDNVLELYGIAMFQNQLSIVTLWMKNGDLPTYIRKSPEVDRMKLCVQVSSGLAYIHDRGIIHGDLKGPVILIDETGAPRISGFSEIILLDPPPMLVQGDEDHYEHSAISIRWAAPELLDEDGQKTKQSDIYSLGMVFLEIITGDIPFRKYRAESSVMIQVMLNKVQPERPAEINKLGDLQAQILWEIMSECWSFEPETRPEVSEVVRKLQTALVGQPRSATVISRRTLGSDIISHLVAKGVPDITSQLDLDNCEMHPTAGGGFGDIHRGQLLPARKQRDTVFSMFSSGRKPKSPAVKVAIKCPRLFYQQDALVGETARNIAREVYTWSKLRHPNILELLGLATFQNQLSIVAPWQENGTLTNYLKKNPRVDGFQLCVQVSSGLAYLHESDTIHGDVKGDNVLVSETGIAKLTDFGNTLLKKYTIEFTGKGNTSPLSMRWSAPELLEGSAQTKEADVYALGMTFLEVVTGDVPFRDRPTDVAVMRAITAGTTPERPENLDRMEKRKSNVLWAITSKCWSFEAAERPTAAEVERELSFIEPNFALKAPGSH